jgi:hypothetical protein
VKKRRFQKNVKGTEREEAKERRGTEQRKGIKNSKRKVPTAGRPDWPRKSKHQRTEWGLTKQRGVHKEEMNELIQDQEKKERREGRIEFK